MQFYLDGTTHSDENKPRCLQRTPAARERGELRSQFSWVPERWREWMLHGVAPANSRAVRSTAARMEFGSMEELEWAGTSSRGET